MWSVAVTPSPPTLLPAIVAATNCRSRLRRVVQSLKWSRFADGGVGLPEPPGASGVLGTCAWMYSFIVEEDILEVRVPDRVDTADNLVIR